MKLAGSCHCGAVQLCLHHRPSQLTECSCSICHRYGARWAYGTARTVSIDCEPESVSAYRWGDGTIDFFHCKRCGCLTHYESTGSGMERRVAVNARMLDPVEMAAITVRLFDGAETWKYLD